MRKFPSQVELVLQGNQSQINFQTVTQPETFLDSLNIQTGGAVSESSSSQPK